MDVSLELDINYANSRPILRGVADPTVSQGPPPVDKPTLQYISEAIEYGDRLPNTEASLGTKTRYRALIVAPQYQVHFTKYGPLPATLNDVYNVHKMLTQRGYDRADIRILVDGDGDTDPTKDNIIKSLQWLVSNAQPEDHRFFHFSGHGTYILSKEGEGKEALRIPEQRGSLHPSDPDLGASSNRATQYTRVSSIQVNRKEDINYYNEAIVTSYKPLPLLDTLTKDVTEYNIIRDSVLNDYFSKLPEGCKLMCTLDCCHSGRLINNNFKLAGAGFRGRCIYATAQGRVPDEPPEAFTDMDDLIEQLGKQTIKDLTPLENDTTGASVSTPAEGASQLPGVSTPQGSPLARGAKTPGVQAAPRPPVFSQNMTQNYISPLVSKIMELLPAEEASRDKIKADMLTWSGCHQRQGAVDYSDKRGGLFTRSFTESVMESSNPVTVEQLFNKLNQRIANEARNLRDGRGQIRPVLQYAQVWTSCKKGDEARAREKLHKEFIL